MSNSERTRNYDAFDPGSEAGDAQDSRKRGYLARNVMPRVRASLESLPASNTTPLVVEIGPGKGALQDMLREAGVRSVSIEVCEAYAISLAKRGHTCHFAHDVPVTLAELARDGEAIGVVVAVDVLEHLTLEEGTKLLRAVSSVLAPGGACILQVPNAAGLFGMATYAADPTHVMAYSEHSLPKVLHASGFTHTDVFPLALPATPADTVRTWARACVFAFVRLLQKIVGATPTRVLTHNLVARATVSSGTR